MNKLMVAAMVASVVWAGAGVGFGEEVAKDAGKGAAEGVQAGGGGGEKKDVRPVRETIISPDASNAVDTDDLVKRLTGEDKDTGGGGDDPMKKLKEIVDRMGDASQRLTNVDSGDVTQEVERRIVMDLDVLIEMAKKSQYNGKAKADKSKDKAQQAQLSKPGKPGGKTGGGTEAATVSEMRNGDATAEPGADLHEKGAEGWGNLQARDRALITQGQQQTFLPSYRAMIERYYEELARLNRSGGR